VNVQFQFQEQLHIACEGGELHLTLVGKGVSPLVSLSPAIGEKGIMDMGAVMAGEYLEKTFQVGDWLVVNKLLCAPLLYKMFDRTFETSIIYSILASLYLFHRNFK